MFKLFFGSSALSVVLIVRPNETLTVGGWTAVGQATLHEAVNDEDDASYAKSDNGTAGDRTVELLEGATVRASFILAPTGSFDTEGYTLDAGELASITSWNDIRVRITDGGVATVFGFPNLATPAGNVTIKVRTKI